MRDNDLRQFDPNSELDEQNPINYAPSGESEPSGENWHKVGPGCYQYQTIVGVERGIVPFTQRGPGEKGWHIGAIIKNERMTEPQTIQDLYDAQRAAEKLIDLEVPEDSGK